MFNLDIFCNFASYCDVRTIMIDYITGKLTDLEPTVAIIEAAGVGYEINIALSTFTTLSGKSEAKLFTTEIIREDAHLLFGFMTKAERSLFLLLTSVSGVGANTARLIMSSFTAAELRQIIATGNVAAITGVKGIGAKTAQRIVVDLKDKVLKIDMIDTNTSNFETVAVNMEIKQEAIAALVTLGYTSAASTKVVDKILQSDPNASVDQVIRQAFKMM